MSKAVRIKSSAIKKADFDAVAEAFKKEGFNVVDVFFTARALIAQVEVDTSSCAGKGSCGPYTLDIKISDGKTDDTVSVDVRWVMCAPRDYYHLEAHHKGLAEECLKKARSAWEALQGKEQV
jgi:hypothetical protein